MQVIEDGYEEGLITGDAFVELSAAYHRVNHRILTRKCYEITREGYITDPEHVIKQKFFCGPCRRTQQMAHT